MTVQYVPTTADVVRFYDEALPLISRLAGHNVHVGYWRSDDDDSTLQQAMDTLTDVMIERISVTAGSRVLDVGCGVGGPAVRLAKTTGAHVVGISTSPVMVAEANRRARAENVAGQVSFLVADAMEELPWPAESFDAAWAIESLVHMPDRAAALRQIGRVLRLGGRLTLTDFYEWTPVTGDRLAMIEDFRRMSFNAPFHRLEEYLSLLRAAGLYLTEFLEISQQVARHYPELLARLRQFKPELAAEYGAEAIAALETFLENCVASGAPNYMLMTVGK